MTISIDNYINDENEYDENDYENENEYDNNDDRMLTNEELDYLSENHQNKYIEPKIVSFVRISKIINSKINGKVKLYDLCNISKKDKELKLNNIPVICNIPNKKCWNINKIDINNYVSLYNIKNELKLKDNEKRLNELKLKEEEKKLIELKLKEHEEKKLNELKLKEHEEKRLNELKLKEKEKRLNELKLKEQENKLNEKRMKDEELRLKEEKEGWVKINNDKKQKKIIVERNNAYDILSDKSKLKNNLQKTKLCLSFINKVSCPHGDKCRYAHSINELGKCFFGDKCRFVKKEKNIYANISKTKICEFKHLNENSDNYLARVGINNNNNNNNSIKVLNY